MSGDRKSVLRRLRPEKTLCALDIGTTKVCALIGRIDDEGALNVQGVGSCRSRGVNRGDVIDIDRTVEAIQKAVGQAEGLAETNVREVLVGVAGDHIHSFNVEDRIPIKHTQRGIDERDRDLVVRKARDSFHLSDEQEVLHTVAQTYIVNGRQEALNPIGLSASELGVRLHMVLASTAATQNIIRCVGRAGLRVRDLALESLVSSLSVLSEHEKELGVAVLDIGGGTTDVAVFKNGCICASGEAPLGGNSITQDIQYVWKTSFHDAENLKKKLGSAAPMNLEQEEMIELPSLHASRTRQRKRRRELAMIIESRVEEILEMSRDLIAEQHPIDDLLAGVVLTGGSSMLADIDLVAERIFNAKARIGHPQGVRGMSGMLDNSPIYSTAVGLLQYGLGEDPGARAFRPAFWQRLMRRRVHAFA